MASNAETASKSRRVGILERLGVSLPDAERTRLGQIWLRARMFVGLAIAVITLGLAVLWDWQAGIGVTILALVSSFDSWVRLRILPTRRPIVAVVMDVTLIHLGMELAGVPDAALGFPFSYIVISSLLLLEPRWAFATITYAGVAIASVARDWFVLESTTLTETATFIVGANAGLYFMLASMGLVSVMVRLMNRSARHQTDQNALQRGLAEASAALLRSSDDEPLESALIALRRATGAGAAFIEMNTQDSESRLSTRLIGADIAPGLVPTPGRRGSVIPWTTRPGRDALEIGQSHPIRFSAGDDGDAVVEPLIAGSDIELAFPIFVDDEWWGVLGFVDPFLDAPWMLAEENILMTAAEMFGAYFERSEARTALHETVTHLDEQVRYHNALSACASLLQSSEDESALDLALAAILQATDADYAYIDENYVDPHNGLSSRIVHDSEKPGPRQPTATQEWWDGPYSEWPTSYAALREGRPVQVRVSELAGDERAAYDAEGIKSELLIPIHVNEEWRGSVAFADYVIERRWDSLEIGALRTAARMIGAFWERRDTRRKLERLVGVQERRLRYQRMITAVMSSLTTLRGDAALGESLDHIMSATETDCVALERRVRHPQRGTVCQPVGEVIRAGYEHLVDRPSTCEGAANLPQSVAEAMAQGRPSTNSLTGELRVPILESDRWVGTLVLLSHESNGTWEPEEIAAIQEAAKWISGFWAMSRSVAADPPPAVPSVRPA